ncbi:hypothetical protein QEN19_002472 [Hanseniaspora menglaensis]
MPNHFTTKPVEILKTQQFVNEIVSVEGFISSITFYDDMIFFKLKDQTGILDITIIEDKVKKFGKKLKSIKVYATTKIYVEGLLQYFPDGIESERGYELVVSDLKLINNSALINKLINSNTNSVSFH